MTTKKPSADILERLAELCMAFKLSTLAEQLAPRLIDAGHGDVLGLVAKLFELEAGDRRERRVDRLRCASRLPPGKTLETLDLGRFPQPIAAKLKELAKGAFLDRCDRVLCFGLAGVGKGYAAAALGHALVGHGQSALYTPTFKLVQDLLAAKRDLKLSRVKLTRFGGHLLNGANGVRGKQEAGREASVFHG